MSRKTAVLIIDNSFTFGGAINSLSHLVDALDKEVFEPIIVSGQSERFLAKHFTGCATYHFLPKLPWIDNRYYKVFAAMKLFRSGLLRRALNLGRLLFWTLFIHLPEALRYVRYGRKHQVALVHLNNIFGSQASGILAAKLLGVPCVAHLRDFEDVHPVTRFYARHIDRHIAISKAIAENLAQLGVAQEKITLVYDAIDLTAFAEQFDPAPLMQEFTLPPNSCRFGLFGRVVDWKGTREFLLAARQVLEANKSAYAFVVGGVSDGDDAYMSEMEQLVYQSGIAERVFFTGFRQDIPALMRFMDIVVHASIRPEPFGMVLIEAMATGRPVVATRAGGPLDIVVDGETGLLVPMGDVRALGGAITDLIRDPVARSVMGEHARSRVNRLFSSKRYATEMETVYRQLCSGKYRMRARVVGDVDQG